MNYIKMDYIKGKLWMLLLALGLVALVLGAVFIAQGVTKSSWMSDAMRLESVTLGLNDSEIAKGNVVDTAAEAQLAGDTIREHRHGIAPNYSTLLGGGRFNASNPDHITYAQAMNMENYLYLSVLGFGVTQMLIGTGVFMLVVALAFGLVGIAVRRKGVSPTE